METDGDNAAFQEFCETNYIADPDEKFGSYSPSTHLSDDLYNNKIAIEVINSGAYKWDPYTNTIKQEGKEMKAIPETIVRYEKLLNNFKAMQGIDKYTGDTYIDRKFNNDMEVALEDVERLFDKFLSAPELQEVGKLISKRLKRKLEAYDIWYDGFKARSSLDETKLDAQTQALYPDAATMDKKLPDILMKLGFNTERANYLADKITVDAARGFGHAWGAAMKGQQSHYRKRYGTSIT